MFTSLLRKLARSRGAATPASPRRPRRLGLETLEDRAVPATVYGITAGNVLIRFDSASPANVTTVGLVSGLGAGETIRGIDFRPRTGQLIASTVTTGSANNSAITTYRINPLNAQATLIGTVPATTLPGAADVPTGYDFNPTVDRIRVVNSANENARLNPNNGTLAGNDTDLTFTAPAVGPVIASAYDRNFDRQNATGVPTTLYGIDRGGSRLVVQGGLNGGGPGGPNGGAITDIGALGVTLDATADAGFDIAASTANGGLGTALAALTVVGSTGLYRINLATGAATLIGAIANGATSLVSIAIVPDAALVVGSRAGAPADVRLLDPNTGAIRLAIQPFGGFVGGIRVATGDVTRDGIPDIVVAAIVAQGHVRVFDGVTGQPVPGVLGSYLAFPGFGGTVNVGVGDVNGDGFGDVLAVANGPGANGHVLAFSGANGSILSSFFSYLGFGGNVTIAAADFNLDGTDEIVTAAGANGHVRVFNANGTDFTSLPGFVPSFLTFVGYFGDVSVAAGDVNGDGRADIVLGSGAGTRGHVLAISGSNNAVLASFFAFEAGFTGGVNVALANRNTAGQFAIYAASGPGRQSEVRAFDLLGAVLPAPFPAFANWVGGATIGGARF